MSEEKTIAPAVHTDELWGGPRLIENAGHEPVPVETKQEYWDLLNRRGLRMKDQQESTTGPERETLEPLIPDAPLQIVTHQLSYDDAQVFYAADRVNRNLGLLETLDCDICFALGRHSGVKTICRPAKIAIECRCGVRDYVGPLGTDGRVVLNPARTVADRTKGLLLDEHGQPSSLPTVLMSKEEAEIVRQYARFLHDRKLSVSYYCRGCWNGRTTAEPLMVKVSPGQVVFTCRCRLRYWQG